MVDFDDQYDLLKQDVYKGIEPVYHDEDFGTDGIKRLKRFINKWLFCNLIDQI